jgi:hypothetical protein
MNRRFFGVALTLACVLLSVAGCETLRTRQHVRHTDYDPEVKDAAAEKVESEGEKILDVRSDGKKSQPFFRSSRLVGGLSSEAREIEGDMGIH